MGPRRASKRDVRSLGYATAPCRVDVRFAPKTTLDAQSVYKKMGYRRVSATDGNGVANSIWQLNRVDVVKGITYFVFYNYCFENVGPTTVKY